VSRFLSRVEYEQTGDFFKKIRRYLDRGIYVEGGTLNVCRKNNLGNRSDRWVHDVYPALLLFFICHHLFRKDHLLQKEIQDQKAGVYDKDSKSFKREEY